ncbi:MAG: hypothetical protein EBU90_03570 [Proteobacteria bacterium]|nr:hypothetical protein [Pseudomonadota bacterium]NBP13404.1 hypothetical protein [bacterium]
MNKDSHLISEAYQIIREQGRGIVKNNASPVQRLAGTISGWNWVANKPSPQTGKYYPAAKKFSNDQVQMKIGDMMNGTTVKPEWRSDFNASVVQWLNDLVGTMNPNINKIKDMLGIPEDINPQNKQQYQQQVLQLVTQMAPASPAVQQVAQAPIQQPTV